MNTWINKRPHYRSHKDLAQFEALNLPLWVFDVDRHAMWWGNPSAQAFWRADSLEALIERDYSTDSEIVRTRLRQVVESPTAKGRIQEAWTLYPDGVPTTVIADIQPVLIEEGRNAILLEASRVLDMQDDPDALRMLEAARSSALMVSSFTMSGRLLAQNPASHSCYAKPLGQDDLLGRIRDEAMVARILTAVKSEGHFEAEIPVHTARGLRTHRVLARRGRDPVTGEFSMVLNEEDVTEHATLRANLERLNNELEARVVERTESLLHLNESLQQEIAERRAAEEKLLHVQKLEAVGQLTGGIAHDFNNLLAVIIGNVELLAESPDSDPSKLDPILRSAYRGAEMTQRLLAFSRQQTLSPTAVDLGALVSELSDLLARTLGETVVVGLRADPGLWRSMADQGQVEAAFLNLALNARDAMPNGGKLTIDCGNVRVSEPAHDGISEVSAGDYVVLSMSDTGRGMTPEVKKRAFEPFFTTKDVGKGSGLGLSMVYGFAKQSGGHVTIESEEARGTTVRLYLPRYAEARKTALIQDQDAMPMGEGERILVLEDDPDVRTLVMGMLKSLNYQGVEAANAAAASELLAKGQEVDLVLSDVVLPGGTSGPQFAKQLRTDIPDVKFIYMSGYAAEAATRDGFVGSKSPLLSKPFQRRDLARALREVLGPGSEA